MEAQSEDTGGKEQREAPLYAAPRPWTWANVTAVVVDCRRRRAVPLTITVSHGHALTTVAFAGLFEPLLPPTTIVPHELRSFARPSIFDAVIKRLAEALSRPVIELAVESMAGLEQEANVVISFGLSVR